MTSGPGGFTSYLLRLNWLQAGSSKTNGARPNQILLSREDIRRNSATLFLSARTLADNARNVFTNLTEITSANANLPKEMHDGPQPSSNTFQNVAGR
jgi:hypothetical protein